MRNIDGRCHFCRRRARAAQNGMEILCKRHKNREVVVDARFCVLPYVIVEVPAPARG